MKVGIIGGGAAGLSAAYELVKKGHQVEVFERAPFLGGQASTFEVGGARLERGYHHLFMSDRHMVDLIHELGLGPKLKWIHSKVGLFYDGRIWPWTSPMDILRFKPLSPIDRLRLGLVTFYLQKTSNWRRFEKTTASQWLPKYMGRRPYQVIWEPMLKGKFGSYYQTISMAWLWGKIYLRVASRGSMLQKEKLGYPMGSFGEVFDVLAHRIQQAGSHVYTSATVKRVVVEEGKACGLEVEMPEKGSHVRPFDRVIATVPSFVFTRLVPPLPQDYMEKLTGVTYLAAVVVVLVLDRPLSHIYWLNVADRSIPFIAVVEQTNFIPPEHYGGKHIAYLANYLAKDDPLYHKDRQELMGVYMEHLKKINPQFQPSWIQEFYYHREEAAQPVIPAGYSQRIPPMKTPIPGLYLANTTQIYPEDRGTNYSVRLGQDVVRLLLQDVG